MDRRAFLRASLGTAAGAAGGGFGPAFWHAAYAAPAEPGAGPYGPLQDPDEFGLRLPAGFSARVVAVSGVPVGDLHGDAGLEYVWHDAPDGGACFATPEGGWVYVSNSEVAGSGGVGTLRFDSDGRVSGAYRILSDTDRNCAGGATPWGTWLSCEETGAGRVWECDPFRESQGVVRPALGVFAHEAVAVDPERRRLYMTEDAGPSGFYRFTPEFWPDLSSGLLEIAVVDEEGTTEWVEVPDPSAATGRTAHQVPGANIFDGGEGIWYDQDYVYFTTKGTNQVWVHDIAEGRTTVLYDAHDHRDAPLTGVDNVTVAPSGDLLVAEDGGNLEIVLITADTREVAPLLRLEGTAHAGSELCGPAFSPDGTRLYFSSQRSSPPAGLAEQWSTRPSDGRGLTFEVTGPFRLERVGIAAIGAVASPSPSPSNPATPSPDAASPAESPAGPTVTPILPTPTPSGSPGGASPTDDAGAGAGAGAVTGAVGAVGVALAAAVGFAVRRRSRDAPDKEPSGE